MSNKVIMFLVIKGEDLQPWVQILVPDTRWNLSKEITLKKKKLLNGAHTKKKNIFVHKK